MRKKIKRRFIRKINLLRRSAILNEFTLSGYLHMLNTVQACRVERKIARKYGIFYEWGNSEWDGELNWLIVPERANNGTELGFRIFMSCDELPIDKQSLWLNECNG